MTFEGRNFDGIHEPQMTITVINKNPNGIFVDDETYTIVGTVLNQLDIRLTTSLASHACMIN